MRISTKLIGVLAAAAAFAAISVPSASAAIVPAKFSSSSVRISSGTVTFKRGAETKTCNLNAGASGATFGGGSEVSLANEGVLGTKFTCPNNGGVGLVMHMETKATYDNVSAKYALSMHGWGSYFQESPWGSYLQYGSWAPITGSWVNGSGVNNSKVTFTNAPIGETAGMQVITMSGTFTATTTAGKLITLSP